MNINPKRLEGETFAEYKERWKFANKAVEIRLRGRKVKQTKREYREFLSQIMEMSPESSKYC